MEYEYVRLEKAPIGQTGLLLLDGSDQPFIGFVTGYGDEKYGVSSGIAGSNVHFTHWAPFPVLPTDR